MWVASRELLPSPPLSTPFFLHLQQKLLLLLFFCLQNDTLLCAPSNRNMLQTNSHDPPSLSLSLSLSRQKIEKKNTHENNASKMTQLKTRKA
jgi:hypothetical protein